MSQVIALNEDSFEATVLQSERPSLVDFWASWCNPCRQITPIIEAIASKYAGFIDVYKVDVESNASLAETLQISSIPVIALFVPGEAPRAVLGFRDQASLESELNLAAYLPQSE